MVWIFRKKVSQNLDKVTAALKTKLARIFPRTEVDGTAAVMSEKVVTCIRLAKELPGRELLSVVASSENSLSDLDSVVLPVMFAARSAALSKTETNIKFSFLPLDVIQNMCSVVWMNFKEFSPFFYRRGAAANFIGLPADNEVQLTQSRQDQRVQSWGCTV